MVTVAVTGASGTVGRRLVPALADDEKVDRVLALDLRSPPDWVGVSFRQVDVRDPALSTHLQDVDVLVHLAFVFDPSENEERMRDVNVFGTRNVFGAAAEAEVGTVVYLSSSVVYGAHPDNDFPLTEESPLRANPHFTYAEHKLEVEQWLRGWSQQHPELTVTVLRPSIIAGEGVDNLLTRQMEAPRFRAVTGHRPPWQFVHVEDVVGAIRHAIHNELPGAYNVSAEGWVPFDEVVAASSRRPLFLPEEVAFSAADALWNLGLGEAPAGEIHYLMHPWILSVDRLKATGWRPTYSNREALAPLAEEHRDRLTLLGMTASRSRVRTFGAVGGLVLLLGLLQGLWRRFRGDERGDSA